MLCRTRVIHKIVHTRSSSTSSFARVTQLFQPSSFNAKLSPSKENSSKLLLQEGYLQQCSPGLYAILPLAFRSLSKLITIVEEEMNSISAQRLLLPTLTSQQLWKTSGRWQDNSELMTMADRHQKKYLLSPTHEEAICDVLSHGHGLGHSRLPMLLYQISSKFRDEQRPRLNLLRAREFIMKDLYSFDVDEKSAAQTYETVTQAYYNIFSRIAVPFVRVEGSCGEIGGSFSHEYHYECSDGEDSLLVCGECGESVSEELLIETSVSTRGDEVQCTKCRGAVMRRTTGIEVGHTFLLGDKYSAPLDAMYRDANDRRRPYVMGCYGVGVSRIVQAAVHTCSPHSHIVWPWALAPYRLCLIGPKRGSKESSAESWSSHIADVVQQQVTSLSGEVIVDDRDNLSIGARVAAAKRAGYPLIVVVGRAALASQPRFEFIDNSLAFRKIAGVLDSDESSGVNKKSGELLTQLELLNRLHELCSVLQNIRVT